MLQLKPRFLACQAKMLTIKPMCLVKVMGVCAQQSMPSYKDSVEVFGNKISWQAD